MGKAVGMGKLEKEVAAWHEIKLLAFGKGLRSGR